jgi:hypothetical protein
VDLSAARITWEARDQEPTFGSNFTFAPRNNGVQWVEAEAQFPDGRRVFATAAITADSPNVVWVNDALPAGAVPGADGGDIWMWVSNNPAPYSGTRAHQSALAVGTHQHYFSSATATMEIGTGDTLYAWVYLDAANPPSEIMLQWNDGSWEHRAYWGANMISYGTDGTPGRVSMGPLPQTGQWVQMKVPAKLVGLEGRTVSGMAFTAYGGRVTWDAAGRLAAFMSEPGNAVPAKLRMAPEGATLTWNSTSSRMYEVYYKDDLRAIWTKAGQVVATGGTSSFVDTGSLNANQRFYLVAEVQ